MKDDCISACSLHVRSAGPNHDAVVIFGWIAEQFHSSDRNFSNLGYRLLRVEGSLVKKRTNQNPNIAHEHAEAGQYQELGELPTCDIALVSGTNRELFLPKRFASRFSASPSPQPIHGSPPTCSPQHRGR